MGSSTQTTKSTSGPSNPDLNKLVSTLSKGIGTAYQPGGTTYVAPSANTTAGWGQALNAAGNQDYSGGLAGALQSYGNRAAGNELGINDPLYAAQRARLSDSVLTDVNSLFTGSGRFGSGSHVTNAVDSLTSALAPIDLAQRNESYGRQAEAAGMLGDLFQSSLLPSSITGAVGAAQDADAQARALGGIDYLGKFTSLLGSAAGASPQTTTTSQPSTPLWQSLLGLGIAAL